jgi:hypothetical protein
MALASEGRAPHPSIGPQSSALTAERAHTYEVAGEAFGRFRNELLDQVGQMIAERVEQLRAAAAAEADWSGGSCP